MFRESGIHFKIPWGRDLCSPGSQFAAQPLGRQQVAPLQDFDRCREDGTHTIKKTAAREYVRGQQLSATFDKFCEGL